MSWISFLYNDGSTFLEMIKLEYVADGSYVVYFNKKVIGNFVIQDDGYFGYYPNEISGYWSSYALRLIANKLDEINKEWDEYIKNNLMDGK